MMTTRGLDWAVYVTTAVDEAVEFCQDQGHNTAYKY